MTRKGATWIDKALVYSPLYIGLCVNEDQFKTELRRLKIPANKWPNFVTKGSDGTTHFIENDKTGCATCLVCIKPEKGLKIHELYGLLCHEAVHVWQEIKNYLNEKNPSIEFEAYAIGNIFQRLVEVYRKQKK